MKILLSAYACEPGKGSEPGVGWHWLLELLKLGHEVHVVTRCNNRSNIEAGLQCVVGADRARFYYVDLPSWALFWKRTQYLINLYYPVWQWLAYRKMKSVHRQQPFDCVHHITFGVFRHFSLMGRLGIPFVFGPVGGGEATPGPLRKHYPLGGRFADWLRDRLNDTARINPFLWQTYAQASLIYGKTNETVNWVPQRYRHKAHQLIEIGLDPSFVAPAPKPYDGQEPFKLLYVGRLLFLKGLPLGLDAFKALLAVKPDASLTLIGRGPERQRLEAHVQRLGIGAHVEWIDWVAHDDLAGIYRQYHAFLFPSLHDSSGNALLEAMGSGLPVVCFNLGGPGVMVTNACGRVVPVQALDGRYLDEATVTKGMAQALIELATHPDLRHQLACGAIVQAKKLNWAYPVRQVYELDLPAVLAETIS